MAEGTPNAKRILIAEDDPDIREALAQVLENEGYQVSTAADGAQALALLRQGPKPSLIILDLMMPVMNGWQFREEQLRDPELAKIPVLVITAYTGAEAKAAAAGAAGLLRKPIELQSLLDAVERLAR